MLAPYSVVIPFIHDFARRKRVIVKVSGLFDLRPEVGNPHPAVTGKWGDGWWPETYFQGVYIWLSDDSDPVCTYFGKSEGRTSTIQKRLSGYFDLSCPDFKLRGKMVLREEWHGYHRPPVVPQRYIVAIGMYPDSADGRCHAADELETALIRQFEPPQRAK